MKESITKTEDPSSRYAGTTWRALGTYVQLVVAKGDRLASAEAATGAILDEMDHACSRFRSDSDLTRANQQAGQVVAVSPLLARAVLAALDAARSTDGLLDPTLGNRMASLGYDRDIDLVRQDAGPVAAPDDRYSSPLPSSAGRPGQPAWRQVEVDPAGSVRVPEGFALDLGSIGKAFVADLVADRIPRIVGTDLLISLGGDIAIGCQDPESPVRSWQIAVAEAPDGTTQQTVELSSGGVATSSTVHRRWRHEGDEMHHVLDPRSGVPAQEVWRTVTVAAASCVAANTASTVSLILGEQAPAWLEDRGLPARLVRDDGSVLVVGGWPAEQTDPPGDDL